MLRLNLSLLISWRYFLMKKSKDANWPSGGALYTFESEVFRKYLCSRNRPLCCEKIAFNSTRRRNFLRSCLTENLSIFLKNGNKI